MSTTDRYTTTYGKPWVDPLRCACGHRLVPGERMMVDSPDNGYSKTQIVGCPACRPDDLGPGAMGDPPGYPS